MKLPKNVHTAWYNSTDNTLNFYTKSQKEFVSHKLPSWFAELISEMKTKAEWKGRDNLKVELCKLLGIQP